MSITGGDDISGLRSLGAGNSTIPKGAPGVDILESFPNRYPHRNYIISISFPEFTSLCPVTGQPDFGTILVEYIPDRLCVESKSFKLYIFAYRSYQSFMETITNKILDDLTDLLDPRWCMVSGLFAPRGATSIHVFCEHFKEMETSTADAVKNAVSNWRGGPGRGR